MIDSYPHVPQRLAPFLAQWDYVTDQLFARLEGLTDEELSWEPTPTLGRSILVRTEASSEHPTIHGGTRCPMRNRLERWRGLLVTWRLDR